MKRSYQYFFLSIAILLSACYQFGIPNPKTFNERLAVGYASVTAVRVTATTLLQSKKITADDAQNVQDQTDNARKGLDIARDYAKTDPKAAEAKRSAVIEALKSTQDYLKGKQ